jgi:NADH dehydrogenase
MVWTGSADTTQQLRIKFADKEAAIEYAKRKGIIYRVIEPNTAKMSIRAYSDNFM